MPLFTQHPDGSYRAFSSLVTGDVTVGADCSFWFNAVVRGDVAPITFGRRVNVQDCAVVHCDTDVPQAIEDDVVIGHSAVVHGRRVGRGTLVGMRATVLSRAEVGAECLVAAGAVVPPGLVVPDRHVAMGVPAKVVRPVRPEELEHVRWLAGHYVELARRHAAGEFDPR